MGDAIFQLVEKWVRKSDGKVETLVENLAKKLTIKSEN